MRSLVSIGIIACMVTLGCGGDDGGGDLPMAGAGGSSLAGQGGADGMTNGGTGGTSAPAPIDAGMGGDAASVDASIEAPGHQGEGTLEQKALAGEGTLTENFGASVSIDGDTLVVSGFDGGVALGSGAVHVFVRNGSDWVLQQKLLAPDPQQYDGFGTPVCVSGDTILVGGKGASAGGAVFVFVRSGSTWTLQQELAASDDASALKFGASVALAGDTAVIGAPNEDTYAGGAAYVFVRSGNAWTEQARLVGSREYVSFFGRSVSIAGDTLLVGAGSRVTTVAAYVFVGGGSSWSEQAQLTASDAAEFDGFAGSVALSGDTAVVGASGDDGHVGSAYVFTRSGTAWRETRKLRGSDSVTNDEFATAVAITGNLIAIGARYHDDGHGAAYTFVRQGTSWTQQYELRASDDAANDYLGSSISASGATVVVGAPIHRGGDVASGAAYVFELQ